MRFGKSPNVFKLIISMLALKKKSNINITAFVIRLLNSFFLLLCIYEDVFHYVL